MTHTTLTTPLACAGRAGALDLGRCGHQHGVLRPLGHQLCREPDARCADRLGWVDAAAVHRRPAQGSARRWRPPHCPAHALGCRGATHHGRPARRVGLPARAAGRQQCRAGPGAAAGTPLIGRAFRPPCRAGRSGRCRPRPGGAPACRRTTARSGGPPTRPWQRWSGAGPGRA